VVVVNIISTRGRWTKRSSSGRQVLFRQSFNSHFGVRQSRRFARVTNGEPFGVDKLHLGDAEEVQGVWV
jgi:hypothetical protein